MNEYRWSEKGKFTANLVTFFKEFIQLTFDL